MRAKFDAGREQSGRTGATSSPVRSGGGDRSRPRGAGPRRRRSHTWKPARPSRASTAIPRIEPVPTAPDPPIWNTDFRRMREASRGHNVQLGPAEVLLIERPALALAASERRVAVLEPRVA